MKQLKINTKRNAENSKTTTVVLRDPGRVLKVKTHLKAAKASPKLF